MPYENNLATLLVVAFVLSIGRARGQGGGDEPALVSDPDLKQVRVEVPPGWSAGYSQGQQGKHLISTRDSSPPR